MTQVLLGEAGLAGLRIGCIFRAVAGLVVGIFEGMASVKVDLHVEGFAQALHRRFEVMHGFGWGSPVLAAKVSQHGGVNAGQLVLVRSPRAG